MSIATISTKGQITLPKEIRVKFHLESGDKIDFRVDEQTETVLLVPQNRKVRSIFGFLERPNQKAISIEEIQNKLKDSFRERKK